MNAKRLLAFMAAFAGLLLPLPLQAADKRIIAVRSNALAPFETALQEFQKCLKEQQVSFILENVLLPEDAGKAEALVNDIKAKRPDLVLTLGTYASRLGREKLKGIPVVFCMVLDPLASNLNNAGVSLDLRPADQVSYLRKNFPEFNRIGIMYNPEKNKEMIKEFKDLKQQGANIVFVEVTAIDQIDNAIVTLKSKADCLLMVSDPTIYTAQTSSQLILRTIQLNLPLVGISPAFVKAGAVVGIYADTQDSGCVASEIAARILKGESPDSIPIQRPKKIKSSLNMVVANRLKVKVEQSTLSAAEQVFQ